MKKSIGKLLLGGALTFGLGLEAKAQTPFVYSPVTNSVVLVPDTVQEYLVQASSSGNGSVSGDTNSWKEQGQIVNLEAIPSNIYNYFSYWSGVPFGMENVNPLVYTNDQPRMNIIGNFSYVNIGGVSGEWLEKHNLGVGNNIGEEDSDLDSWKNLEEYLADTNPTNEYSFPSVLYIKNNSSSLEIPNTSLNRNYTFQANSNLLSDSWSYLTNSLGNSSNLVYNLTQDSSDKNFYRYNVGLPE